MNAVKGFLASWAGHLGGYVVSAAGIVSAIDPKLIPPQYSFLTAVAGLIVIASHNSYKVGTVSGAATAAANAAAAALKAVPPAAAALLLAVLMLPGISGCSTAQLAKANAVVTKVNAAVTSPQAQPIIQAGALAAVATAEQHGVTAAQIQDIMRQALAADQGTAATLASVGAVINAQLVKLKLPAGDVAAIEIVEVSVGAAIQAQVGGNATLAQSQAAVADVLTDVLHAAGG